MKEQNNYNPTCLVTGKTDKLRMYPVRDKNENMIGWIFLHEDVDIKEIGANIQWNYNVSIKNTEL